MNLNQLLIVILSVLFVQGANSQNIDFVDLELKQKLVYSKVVDTNLDGDFDDDADLNDDDEISFEEAEAVRSLRIQFSTIESAADLVHFKNLRLLTLRSIRSISNISLSELQNLERVTMDYGDSELTVKNHPNLKKCTFELNEEVRKAKFKRAIRSSTFITARIKCNRKRCGEDINSNK